MSGREWKPGDVAHRHGQFERMTGIFVSGCSVDQHDSGPHWHYENGGWSPIGTTVKHAPLVVISPEDREQVEALLNAYYSRESESHWGDLFGQMQEALRSLLAPPQPEEPTGLGAVVEDAEGRVFIRHVKHPQESDDQPLWVDLDGDFHRWSDIAAARVLHAGVPTPEITCLRCGADVGARGYMCCPESVGGDA